MERKALKIYIEFEITKSFFKDPPGLKKFIYELARMYPAVYLVWGFDKFDKACGRFMKYCLRVQQATVSAAGCGRFFNEILMSGLLPKNITALKKTAKHVKLMFNARNLSETAVFPRIPKAMLNRSVLNAPAESNLISVYETAKKAGFKKIDIGGYFILPVSPVNYIPGDKNAYIAEWLEFFDYWIADTGGAAVPVFTNLVRFIFDKKTVGRECSHSSCMGSVFCVDNSGNLYHCRCAGAIVEPVGNAEDLSGAFNTTEFDKLLDRAITHRENCRKDCPAFQYCQGGCPAEINTFAGEVNCGLSRRLFAHAESVVQRLKRESVPLDKLNPSVLSVVIDAMTISG